jgi:hypothetical protein
MTMLRRSVFAVAVLLGSGLAITQASAMPAAGLTSAASQVADNAQDVRYVCGPYRCWSRPGVFVAPGAYVGPGSYWHRCGWRRCWW